MKNKDNNNKWVILIGLVLLVYLFGKGETQSFLDLPPEATIKEKPVDTSFGLPDLSGSQREGQGCVSDLDCTHFPPKNYPGGEIKCREDGMCDW